jgi:hypothetical protein
MCCSRFKKIHLAKLKSCLQFDPFYIFGNGSLMSGDEMFLLFLGRVGQFHRLIDWEKFFGIDQTVLCQAFQLIIEQVIN